MTKPIRPQLAALMATEHVGAAKPESIESVPGHEVSMLEAARLGRDVAGLPLIAELRAQQIARTRDELVQVESEIAALDTQIEASVSINAHQIADEEAELKRLAAATSNSRGRLRALKDASHSARAALIQRRKPLMTRANVLRASLEPKKPLPDPVAKFPEQPALSKGRPSPRNPHGLIEAVDGGGRPILIAAGRETP